MKIIILVAVLLFIPTYSHASWLTNFCERHLIANNPWPYGDLEAQDLAYIYSRRHEPEVYREMDYRLGLNIPDNERIMFLEVMK